MSNLNDHQQAAWDIATSALRRHYLQRNSQIHNLDEWLDERVAETMQTIMNIHDHDNLQMISDNCKKYRDKLTDAGNQSINIHEPTSASNTRDVWLDHATWMCIEILRKIDQEPESGLKINRWYGCLQGLLMTGGIHTLDECRDHNRTRSTT